jgi:hypothetical protein
LKSQKGIRVLEDGTYTQFTVAISNDVSQDYQLVQALIGKLKEGSQQLFDVTEGRTFIRDAIIVVPMSWEKPNSVEVEQTGINFDGETSTRHYGSSDMQLYSTSSEGKILTVGM